MSDDVGADKRKEKNYLSGAASWQLSGQDAWTPQNWVH